MATSTYRETPYSQFNFRVNLGTGGPGPDDYKAGFQEASGLGMEVHVAEYRAGNSKENSPQTITGTTKFDHVVLKRGVIGDTQTLYSVLSQVRDGDQTQGRTVIIQLMDESRQNVAQTWTLTNARPVKLSGPALTGKGTDVAVEEFHLVYDRLDVS
jgi:phage tail-like protein